MASSPQNSQSHHRILLEGREFEICVNWSGSSVSADGHPHMLVEATLDSYAKFAVPSPGGGFYDFGSYIPPSTGCRLRVDDPSLHFSTLDASRESIAPLLTAGNKPPLLDKILEVLGPDISRLAHASLQSAEVEGHTAMKIGANAICFLKVDLDTFVHYYRTVHGDGGQDGSLGTCSVCLDEMQKKWIRPAVRLACSHVFHLGCITPWLRRQNSCPLCRSKQPIVMEF